MPITGTPGDDTLPGTVGADDFFGLTGNDTYFVNHPGDTTAELDGEGNDRVMASVSWILADNQYVEIIYADATGLDLSGNNLSNNIFGTGGDDTLRGNDGNDWLYGYFGNDQLFGGAGNDYMQASRGTLRGGAGDDIYVMSGAVTLVENAGEGFDTVYITGATSLPATSTSYMELFIIPDVASTYAVTIPSPVTNGASLFGNDGVNTFLNGLNFPYYLYGYGGDDYLAGGSVNDYLDGGTGADRMEGWAGNDTYVVDNANDWIHETNGNGFDQAYVFANYTLTGGASVELLIASGGSALNIGGNQSAQTIYGSAQGDMIDGGGGLDKLFGFAGADLFVFTSTAFKSNDVQATIYDFVQGTDHIALLGTTFGNLAPGALGPGVFVLGTTSTDTSPHILYDQTSGGIFFDQDGTGPMRTMLFAAVFAGMPLDSSDFAVI